MTSIDALAGQSAQVQQSSTQLNQDFDDFLTLLTTQLQNQDPLDPQDTSEFTNQLVQFSQVEQQIRSNDILDDLRALDVLQITQIGLGFVGLEVELAGDTFNFDGQSEVDLGYNLPSASTGTTVSIRNEAGNVVHTFSGETSPGQKSYTWDGFTDDGLQAPPGQYTITVSGQDVEGNSLILQRLFRGLWKVSKVMATVIRCLLSVTLSYRLRM